LFELRLSHLLDDAVLLASATQNPLHASNQRLVTFDVTKHSLKWVVGIERVGSCHGHPPVPETPRGAARRFWFGRS
jgi:hypothetical protein